MPDIVILEMKIKEIIDELKGLCQTNGLSNQASEEVVIIDNDEIVAGMTSSKAIDNNSDLYGKVNENGKGDVRIWAGKMQTDGDLTSTPFNVTSNGALTINGTAKSSYMKFVAHDGTIPTITITSPSYYKDENYTQPVGDKISNISVGMTTDPDTNGFIPQISINNSISGSNSYGTKNLQLTAEGLYFGLNGYAENAAVFSPSTCSGADYSISASGISTSQLNVSSNNNGNTLFVIENLPTSDPKIRGALWNNNGTLKMSNG